MGLRRTLRIKDQFKGRPLKASDITGGTIHAYWMDEQPVQQSSSDGYVPPTVFPTPGTPVFLPQATRVMGVDVSGTEPGEKRAIRTFELSISVSSEENLYGVSVTCATVVGVNLTEEAYNDIQFNPSITITSDRPEDFDPPLLAAENIGAIVADGYFAGGTVAPDTDWFAYLNDRHVDHALEEVSYSQVTTSDETTTDPTYVNASIGKDIFDALFEGLL